MHKKTLALSVNLVARELGRSFGEKVAQDAVERSQRNGEAYFPYFRYNAEEIRDSLEAIVDVAGENAHPWTAEEIKSMARDHFLSGARSEARRTRERY